MTRKSKSLGSNSYDIAVVGMACWYPGAQNLLEFWENILARRVQFRRMLDVRLPMEYYYDPNKQTPDKTYGNKAAYIDGFEFDWASNRFPKTTFESTDLVHWLALDVATKAIHDAGIQRKSIQASKTGVLVGNSLAGEVSRASGMRMRWPYVEKVLRTMAVRKGMSAEESQEFIKATEELFKSTFAPITEDSLAGSLANTIAGRIANNFNVDGGGFVIDGACASSLLAISNAATSLVTKDLDLAVVGGVDVSIDAVEMIGFAKVGALAEKEMRVYDRDGKGFLPGEGCGFVVLKRLDDAVRDKNKIYAVVKGWGVSSDGSGGLVAPKASGQALALQRAYAKAGYKVSDCQFIEGHGTGTAVGDRRELEGIQLAIDAMGKGEERSTGITSLKAVIGHTKAAAGVGAFIKTVMSVNRRVLPPTSGVENRNPVFEEIAKNLYPLSEGEIRKQDEKIRAGVSAMGFGGINCHVTLESYGEPLAQIQPVISEKALLSSQAESELFLFAEQSIQAMKERIQSLMDEAQHISQAELTDIAAELTGKASCEKPFKAALIANSPTELQTRLMDLLKLLESVPAEGELKVNDTQTVCVSNKTLNPKIGFLFPGQGSQKLKMGSVLVQRFPWAEQLLKEASSHVKGLEKTEFSDLIYRPLQKFNKREQVTEWESQLTQTSIAQPAICMTSYMWAKRLEDLGITPVLTAGHSLGELTALAWAGAYSFDSLMKLSAERGRLMSTPGQSAGGMASLSCDREKAKEIIQEIEPKLVIANMNGPSQTVVSGEVAGIELALKKAREMGVSGVRLNVSNAFHSPLMKAAALELKKSCALPKPHRYKCEFVSGVEGKDFSESDELADYVSNQVVSSVDFISLVEKAQSKCDLLIEVGPGAVLTGLVKALKGPRCLPVEPNPNRQSDFLKLVGHCFTAGVPMRLESLFAGRLVRPYVSFAQKKFIINPCERPFPEELLTPLRYRSGEEGDRLAEARASMESMPVADVAAKVVPMKPVAVAGKAKEMSRPEVKEILISVLAEVTGFQKDAFKMEMRLLDDLNLDSIKASEAISSLTQRCSVNVSDIDPIQLANSNLDEIIDIIMKARPQSHAVEMVAVSTPAAVAAGMPVKAKVSGDSVQHVEVAPSQATLKSGSVNVEDFLYETVARVTGFERSMLNPQLRLLDDLNLDSIKASEIISSLLTEYPNTEQVDPIQFANSTLQDLVQFFSTQKSASATVVPLVPHAKAEKPGDSELELLFKTTSEVTGYPVAGLTSAMIPSKDLALSLDQVKEIFTLVCQKLNITPDYDPEIVLTQSYRDLVRILGSMKGTTQKNQMTPLPDAGAHTWVRNFVVKIKPSNRPEHPEFSKKRVSDDMSQSRVLIIHEEDTSEFREALIEKLTAMGASCSAKSFSEAQSTDMKVVSEFGYIFYLNELAYKASMTHEEKIKRAISRLRFLCSIPRATDNPRRNTTLTNIQFGDGKFGHGEKVQEFGLSVYHSVMQSLQFERADLRVRNIDLASVIDVKMAVNEVIGELHIPEKFSAVGYLADGTRVVPVLQNSSMEMDKKRPLTWTTEDVVVVSGGAKGITAKCAFAFAQKNKVKMALLGSSPKPNFDSQKPGDKEILENFKMFQEAGIQFHYYQCDISNGAKVHDVLKTIVREMGSITGILHGAGRNEPARISKVSEEKAWNEVAPKLTGIDHLLTGVDQAQLKMVFALTSVIGIAGVPGNAWYGFSNEAMNLYLAQFKTRHPKIEVITSAYAMWDEVGMATKLGSDKAFAGSGVGLIPVREGTSRFLHLTEFTPGTQQVAVTPRLWPNSFLTSTKVPDKKFRFLESVRSSTLGVETICRAKLNVEKDIFLKDHCYNGTYLLPGVFALEAMAQVAAYTLGVDQFEHVVLEDIQFAAPIVVKPEGFTEIEICALVDEKSLSQDEKLVKVTLSSEVSKFKKENFSCVIRVPKNMTNLKDKIWNGEKPLDYQVHRELYGPLLFHGPSFQRIQHFYRLSSQEAVSATRVQDHGANSQDAFGDRHSEFILGDPFARDSMLQSGQAVTPKFIMLPMNCKKWEIFSLKTAPGTKVCKYQLKDLNEKRNVCSILLTEEDGTILERVEESQGVVVRKMPQNKTPEEILVGSSSFSASPLKKKLAAWSKPEKIREFAFVCESIKGLEKMSKAGRHQAEVVLFEKAWQQFSGEPPEQAKAQLDWLESGKPTVKGSSIPVGISISHKGDICCCVLASEDVGCDLEEVQHKSADDWKSLLGPHLAKELADMTSQGHDLNISGALLWSAREAAGKYFESKDVRFSKMEQKSDGYHFHGVHGDKKFSVKASEFQFDPSKTFVFALALAEHEVVKAESSDFDFSSMQLPHSAAMHVAVDPAKGMYIRWPVTFKDASNVSRTIFFSKFAEWQGRAREIALFPLMNEASQLFTSGDAGWVTNAAETRFFKSGKVGDILECRISSSLPYGNKNSAVDITYDWYRVDAEGKEDLMAQSQMQITWVRVIGHGLVEVAPFPDSFLEFFRSVGTEGVKKMNEVDSNLFGPALYSAPRGISTEPHLGSSVFETTLEDSNLVGNVYFSNYSVWLGRARDKFLYKAFPEIFKADAKSEFYCVRSYIKHLREAMPFDQIQTVVRMKSVHQKGLRLYVEFFRFVDGKRGEKIAFAEHDLAWTNDTRNGVVAQELPQSVVQAFLEFAKDSERASAQKATG